jgi:hypothetical protein
MICHRAHYLLLLILIEKADYLPINAVKGIPQKGERSFSAYPKPSERGCLQ